MWGRDLIEKQHLVYAQLQQKKNTWPHMHATVVIHFQIKL